MKRYNLKKLKPGSRVIAIKPIHTEPYAPNRADRPYGTVTGRSLVEWVDLVFDGEEDRTDRTFHIDTILERFELCRP